MRASSVDTMSSPQPMGKFWTGCNKYSSSYPTTSLRSCSADALSLEFARWSNTLRRGGERGSSSQGKNQRLELFRYVGMHHWTVPESLYVCSQALLIFLAPNNLAFLLAGSSPFRKTSDNALNANRLLWRNKIYEGVAEIRSPAPIHRKVNKVIFHVQKV